MRGLDIVLLLLAVSAALRLIAERLAIPYAAILVVGGLGLAVIPGLPRVGLPPDVLFLVFVPPLLYWGAVSFPLRDLRREMGAMVRLAVALVLISTLAVAAVAHAMNPVFTWAAAFTLGAIVAPPDPVAVFSAMRSLKLPRPVQSILEGEGLVNDAVALVAYRMSVAAAVTGIFSASVAGMQLLIGAIGGVAIGLVVAVIIVWVRRVAHAVPVVGNTISLLTPFASFLPAELAGVSGVLAVVTTGLYVGRVLPRFIGPDARVQINATWNVVTFMLESLVFILVGLELPYVTRALQHTSMGTLVRESLAVVACLVVVRVAWVMPSTYIFRRLGRWFRRDQVQLPEWRSVFFIAWAGLRGGDALVLALALPKKTASGARFPASDEIVFITFVVIFITLVVQSPALATLARRLGLRRGPEDEREEAHARLAAAEAGLRILDEPSISASKYPEVPRYIRQRHRQRARRWAARESQFGNLGGADTHATPAPSHDAGVLDESRSEEYRRIRSAMVQAEQRAVLALRDRGEIDDEVMRRVLHDLDLEAILLETREPVIESASEVPASIRAKQG